MKQRHRYEGFQLSKVVRVSPVSKPVTKESCEPCLRPWKEGEHPTHRLGTQDILGMFEQQTYPRGYYRLMVGEWVGEEVRGAG